MVEYGFNTIVAIQAVDTTDNTIVNLCMSMAIDNSRGIVLLNQVNLVFCFLLFISFTHIACESSMGFFYYIIRYIYD